MKPYIFFVLLAAGTFGAISAETSTTHPIGFNKIVCLTNSDTIVGVPFRQQGSMADWIAGAPGEVTGEPDLAEISLQTLSLEPGSLGKHYLKFDGGARDGRWYDITSNSATSITVNLNGDDLAGVGDGDRVIIAQYWTLDTLFPPDQATTGWVENSETGEFIQNGHAIMASLGTRASQRRTLVLLPDIEGDGINRSANGFYYIHDNQWKIVGGGTTNLGETILYPDSILTIQNPDTVDHPTVYRSSGEVLIGEFTIPLLTQTVESRDTFIGLPRPVDLTLSELHLWESGAFVQSSGTRASGRRDEVLVFDNSQTSINKSVVVSYYHNGTNWVAVGDSATNRDNDVIPAGAGFIVRKYPTDTGQTAFWNNVPSY